MKSFKISRSMAGCPEKFIEIFYRLSKLATDDPRFDRIIGILEDNRINLGP